MQIQTVRKLFSRDLYRINSYSIDIKPPYPINLIQASLLYYLLYKAAFYMLKIILINVRIRFAALLQRLHTQASLHSALSIIPQARWVSRKMKSFGQAGF